MDGTSEEAATNKKNVSKDVDTEAASLAASEALAQKLEQEFLDEQLARELLRAMEEEDRSAEQPYNRDQEAANIVTPVMSLKELRHEFYLSSDDEDQDHDDFNNAKMDKQEQEDSKSLAFDTKTVRTQDLSGVESEDNAIVGKNCGSPSALDDEHLARYILQSDMDEAAAEAEALAISLSMDLQSKSAESSSRNAKMPTVTRSGLEAGETTPPLQQLIKDAPSHSPVSAAASTSPVEYRANDHDGGGGDETAHHSEAHRLQENELDQVAEASGALAKTASKELPQDFADSKPPAVAEHRLLSQNELLDQAALMRMFNMESQSHFAAASCSMPRGQGCFAVGAIVGAKKKPPPPPPTLGLSEDTIPSAFVTAPAATSSFLDTGGVGDDDKNVCGGGGGGDMNESIMPVVDNESIDSIPPVEDGDEIVAFRLRQDDLDQAAAAASEALAHKLNMER